MNISTMSLSTLVVWVLAWFVFSFACARLFYLLSDKRKRYSLVTFPSSSEISAQGYATIGVTRNPSSNPSWTTSQQRIAAMITMIEKAEKSEPLEETWSNEKVEAWRVIGVTVEKGDDGLWLGFPHPNGPTEDVVTPKQHPVGVELHAECRTYAESPELYCDESPGENCQSSYGYGCGFYAYKTRDAAMTYVAITIPRNTVPLAIAKVLLSGKVIEHEEGYRGEILEVVEVESVQYPDSALSAVLAIRAQSSPFFDISGGV